jgi:hypothetical protein
MPSSKKASAIILYLYLFRAGQQHADAAELMMQTLNRTLRYILPAIIHLSRLLRNQQPTQPALQCRSAI